nr:tetratricopeptide repeat protein [Acidobacteriota bacterium]
LLLLLAFLAGVVVSVLVTSLVVRLGPERGAGEPSRALAERAIAEIVAEDHPAAATALRHAVESRPDDHGLFLLLADQQSRAGDAARAVRTLEVLLAQRDLAGRTRAAALLLRARVLERAGELEAAREACEEAEQAGRDWPAPLVALEQLLTRLGRMREAVAAAERLATVDRERGRVVSARRRVLLARELLADGLPREAAREAERALTESRPLPAAEMALGDALFQARDPKRAREAWLRAAQGSAALAPLVVDRLEELEGPAAGRSAARQFARDALARDPEGPSAWRLAGWLADDALRRGQAAEARGFVERIEQLNPRSAAVPRLRGRLALLEDAATGRALLALRTHWEGIGGWGDPWRCQRCGFTLADFEWRCPSCRAWESLA